MLTLEQARERIELIAGKDGRYDPAAFFFVNDSVAAALKWLKSGEMRANDSAPSRGGGEDFHISCRELLEAMRRLARERWGCLARQVLENWGVASTGDVGEIVFMMVDDEKLEWRRRKSDTKEEFRDVYDFKAVFDVWGGD
ncbi:MAG: hypothetical protein LBU23_09025 [Planctomycetota bacterium]|jgi:uncharacterized repeat protein (TIGR04138 family)|nr:hypothetical protein [Planctomycetota bacterium]